VKGDQIPPGDDVARHCRSSDYVEENGQARVLGDAFEFDPGGVSVTWVDYFQGSREERLAAVSSIIRSTRTVRASHRLAVISVTTIIECGRAFGADVSVEHDPIFGPPPNPAHCLVNGIATDATALRELLALKTQAIAF
jgi:hypothetical protein